VSNYYRPGGFGSFSFFPPVIKSLLIINGVIFFLQMIGGELATGTGYTLAQIITRYFGLIPIDGFVAGRMGSELIVWNFYPWQLISYQFLHAGFFHILFNMFILWLFGVEIENLWGSKKFLLFYLGAGIVGGLCQILLTPIITGGPFGPTVGASGAIMGVMVAFGMMFPNRMIYVYFLIPVKVKYFIGFLILLDLFAINSGGNVAHLAHLGGALTGLIFMLLNKKDPNYFSNIFGGQSSSYGGKGSISEKFGSFSNRFKKKENIEEAKYYDIEDEESVSQAEIDAILDKISQSGYQNLTEKEKKILFEASKKMK
jgi:membrane associated rhomboid family serine protease